MQVGLRIGPVPHREHDVALATLRARRRGGRHGAGRDAVGPIRPHGQRARLAGLVEAVDHAGAGLPGLQPALPCRRRIVERAQRLGDFARGLVAHLVAAGAAVGVDDVADPLALAPDRRRDPVAGRAGAREVALRRHPQQRQPGTAPGSTRRPPWRSAPGPTVRVTCLPGRGLDLRRVHQAVAADPDVVVGLGQIGHQEAAAVVGDDDLAQRRRQLGGLGDDPDAGFGRAQAHHHAADVVAVHATAAWPADCPRTATSEVSDGRRACQHRQRHGHRSSSGHGDLLSGDGLWDERTVNLPRVVVNSPAAGGGSAIMAGRPMRNRASARQSRHFSCGSCRTGSRGTAGCRAIEQAARRGAQAAACRTGLATYRIVTKGRDHVHRQRQLHVRQRRGRRHLHERLHRHHRQEVPIGFGHAPRDHRRRGGRGVGEPAAAAGAGHDHHGDRRRRGLDQRQHARSTDAQKRLISVVAESRPSGQRSTTTYTAWDAAGRPTMATVLAGRPEASTMSMSYDDARRMQSTTSNGITCTQTFDANGNPAVGTCAGSHGDDHRPHHAANL